MTSTPTPAPGAAAGSPFPAGPVDAVQRTDDALVRQVDRLGPDDLRARGSLKWTGTDAEIAAWVAESDLGTAPAVTAALHAAVERGLTGYVPPSVQAGVASACAGWYRQRYGWDVDADRVHLVSDVLAALRITVEERSRPGSPLIVPTPSYMPFLTAPHAWDRQVLQAPMTRAQDGRWALDLDTIAAAFRAGGHLLVLTNPHNPTGRVFEREELEALADVVEAHGGRVFSDEIHAPLVLPGRTHLPYAAISPAAAAHTVTATSASKAWNVAGLKCAQVLLSDDADVSAWARFGERAAEGASTLGAVAATAAYRDGGPWLDAALRYLDGNRAALARTLADAAGEGRTTQVGYAPPEGTYLAWLDLRPVLPAGVPADLGGHVRTRAGVEVVDGAACGAPGRGHVRLNLAMPRALVVEAGRRIARLADGT